MQKLGKYLLGAVSASVLALGVTAGASDAATFVSPGGSYQAGFGDYFFGLVVTEGAGPDSEFYHFYTTPDSVGAGTVNASLTDGLAGLFTGLTVSWLSSDTLAVLSSTALVGGVTMLSTSFADEPSQFLVFSWDAVQLPGVGFDFDVTTPIPLPAAGLLLGGALVALAARHRKTA